MIVYKAVNKINKKIYIGKTSLSLEERKKSHEYDSKEKSNLYFHRAIRKYGPENFEWKIIAICKTEEELNKAEIGAIFITRSFGKDGENFDEVYGYNMTKGGEGTSGYSFSKESKQLLSKIKSIQYIGKGNPRYGINFVWMYKIDENNKIKNKRVNKEDVDFYLKKKLDFRIKKNK